MKNKVLVIDYRENETARRQSTAFYNENEETGGWCWECPEGFSDSQRNEWDRIMSIMSDVGGEDLRAIICGVGLSDWCLDSVDGDYEEIVEPEVEEGE